MDAIQLLTADHRKVEQLMQQALQGGDAMQLKQVCMQIDKELTVHAEIEEKIFYPAIRKQPGMEELIKDAYHEHGEVKMLLNDIAGAEPTSSEGKQSLTKLQKLLQHHIHDEEDKLFPKVQQTLGQDMVMQLGQQMQKAKQQAEQSAEMLGQQKLQFEMSGQAMQQAQM
jgi:hemerythrin superfamily protein